MDERIDALKWNGNYLELLDQRLLPHEEVIVQIKTLEDCFDAIRSMVVRGAPLIGFSAIWGMVLWQKNHRNSTVEDFKKAAEYLSTSRPTAINLEFELKRCISYCEKYFIEHGNLNHFDGFLKDHAIKQFELLHSYNQKMANSAETFLDKTINKENYNIMTLCNTGYLACGPMGTALGVVDHLHSQNKVGRVYACETRPYLQGARLTSYELKKIGVPHDIVVEGAMSYILGKGLVDVVFIGADRIAKNGDTANKIGSSTLSIICAYYNIPFFVVAPTSSFDLNCDTGHNIPIELRDEDEIHFIKNIRITPYGTTTLNPSFDISEAKNITGIICENGLINPVNEKELLGIVNNDEK